MDNLYKYNYKPCTVIAINTKTGETLEEISLIAIDTNSKKLMGIGSKAQDVIPTSDMNLLVYSPFKNGMVANFEESSIFFKEIINKVYKANLFKLPKVIVQTPPEITEVEERAFIEAIRFAKIKNVLILKGENEEAIASFKDDVDVIIKVSI